MITGTLGRRAALPEENEQKQPAVHVRWRKSVRRWRVRGHQLRRGSTFAMDLEFLEQILQEFVLWIVQTQKALVVHVPLWSSCPALGVQTRGWPAIQLLDASPGQHHLAQGIRLWIHAVRWHGLGQATALRNPTTRTAAGEPVGRLVAATERPREGRSAPFHSLGTHRYEIWHNEAGRRCTAFSFNACCCDRV